MKKMTKKFAREVVDYYMSSTGYINNYFMGERKILSYRSMFDMLYGMGFGEPEAHTILASMVVSGAEFLQDMDFF